MEAEQLPESSKQGGLYPKELIQKCYEEYVQGKATLKLLAQKYGINLHCLNYHREKKGWVKDKQAYEAAKAKAALAVPYAQPEVEIKPANDYQGSIQRFLDSASQIEQQWQEAVEHSRDEKLTPSERTSWARVAKDLHVRWQETLRIPAVAAIKPSQESKPVEKPVLPIEE